MSMKRIAEIAGVSVPAVSAALRGKPNVSAATRGAYCADRAGSGGMSRTDRRAPWPGAVWARLA